MIHYLGNYIFNIAVEEVMDHYGFDDQTNELCCLITGFQGFNLSVRYSIDEAKDVNFFCPLLRAYKLLQSAIVSGKIKIKKSIKELEEENEKI